MRIFPKPEEAMETVVPRAQIISLGIQLICKHPSSMTSHLMVPVILD
jgi:hypothetical protein